MGKNSEIKKKQISTKVDRPVGKADIIVARRMSDKTSISIKDLTARQSGAIFM